MDLFISEWSCCQTRADKVHSGNMLEWSETQHSTVVASMPPLYSTKSKPSMYLRPVSGFYCVSSVVSVEKTQADMWAEVGSVESSVSD